MTKKGTQISEQEAIISQEELLGGLADRCIHDHWNTRERLEKGGSVRTLTLTVTV